MQPQYSLCNNMITALLIENKSCKQDSLFEYLAKESFSPKHLLLFINSTF